MSSPIASNNPSGARLVAVDGRELPLAGMTLHGEARGGLGKLLLVQRFRNPYGDPLRVTYQLPLPADGAVSGFAFRVGARRVVGEVDRRAAARERFEQALLAGRTAALIEEERTSLFTQELGNLPPGAAVEAEITIDLRLAWADGSWELRFPTTCAPRYLSGPGVVADATAIAVDVADRALPPRLALSLTVRDLLVGGQPSSPSHPLRSTSAAGATEIVLADDRGAPLDRDLVVRWPVALPHAAATLDLARPAASQRLAEQAFGLLTLVPPSSLPGTAKVPRDLIVLLDTSGSMGGAPLAQAQAITAALIDTLDDGDQLELIEFSTSPRRWRQGAAKATAAVKGEALAWLRGLRASGGTEMHTGILEALRPLRGEAQRQIVLVTDGLIGFEREIVETLNRALPPGSRLHTVGVGSAVNRSLTGPAARAGRGVEVVVGLEEDAERAIRRLVPHTAAPVVVDVSVGGSAVVESCPAQLPDLFAAAPVRIALRLRPEGGEVVVQGRGAEGGWSQRLRVPAVAPGSGSSAIVTLFGREQVEDLETALAGTGGDDLDGRIERLGLDFQIATRLTSWIAISAEPTVDPTAPTRSERLPHQLPHGLSAEGLGLRAAAPPATRMAIPGAVVLLGDSDEMSRSRTMAAAPPPSPAKARAAAPMGPGDQKRTKGDLGRGLFQRVRDLLRPSTESEAPPPAEERAAEADRLAVQRRLRGQLRSHKDDLAVIEATIEGARLDWSPGREVTVELDDGQRCRVEVVVEQSTRAGALGGGQALRLVLRLGGLEARRIRGITVDATLEIVL